MLSDDLLTPSVGERLRTKQIHLNFWAIQLTFKRKNGIPNTSHIHLYDRKEIYGYGIL